MIAKTAALMIDGIRTTVVGVRIRVRFQRCALCGAEIERRTLAWRREGRVAACPLRRSDRVCLPCGSKVAYHPPELSMPWRGSQSVESCPRCGGDGVEIGENGPVPCGGCRATGLVVG